MEERPDGIDKSGSAQKIVNKNLRAAVSAIEDSDDELVEAQYRIRELEAQLGVAEKKIDSLLDDLHSTENELHALKTDIAAQVAAYRKTMVKP